MGINLEYRIVLIGVVTMIKEKVLLYGNGISLRQNIYWINQIYDVVGITGNDILTNKKSDIGFNLYTYILEDALDLNYDKILVTSCSYTEIREKLIKDYGKDPALIICFLDEWKIRRRISFGEKNSDVTFLVYRPCYSRRFNGFMNFFEDITIAYQYAKDNNYKLVVDMKNYFVNYMSESEYGKINLWERFFSQPSSYTLDEVYESRNVILADTENGYDIKESMGIDIYDVVKTEEENNFHINAYKKLSNNSKGHFNRTIDLHNNVLNEEKRIGFCENVLGVIARGTDYVCLKPKKHPIPMENKTYIIYVKNIMIEYGFSKVFLATEDNDILNQFISEFDSDKLMYTGQRRFHGTIDKSIGAIELYNDNDGYHRCMDYNMAIAILSDCGGLVSNCLCGAAVGAILQNTNKYRCLQVLYNGVYD
jgi:hypothetical protein